MNSPTWIIFVIDVLFIVNILIIVIVFYEYVCISDCDIPNGVVSHTAVVMVIIEIVIVET